MTKALSQKRPEARFQKQNLVFHIKNVKWCVIQKSGTNFHLINPILYNV